MQRLQKIDATTIGDHYYLNEEDDCWFFGEYTAGAGFDASDTNSLILNLKKGMDRKDTPEWKYKEDAVRRCVKILAGDLGTSSAK